MQTVKLICEKILIILIYTHSTLEWNSWSKTYLRGKLKKYMKIIFYFISNMYKIEYVSFHFIILIISLHETNDAIIHVCIVDNSVFKENTSVVVCS